MIYCSRPSRCDHRNTHGFTDGRCQFAIESCSHSIESMEVSRSRLHRGLRPLAPTRQRGGLRAYGRLARKPAHREQDRQHQDRGARRWHTTACAPKLRPIASINVGSASAAELTLTLSAPASKTCAASSAERMPPPTAKGRRVRGQCGELYQAKFVDPRVLQLCRVARSRLRLRERGAQRGLRGHRRR